MSDDQLMWTDPTWLAEVSAWIDGRLKRHQIHRTGVIEQAHLRPWSTVLRVPTDQGSFYFKALPENLRYEVSVVAGLGERFPDRVPRLLAMDQGRGWMLQFEGGELFRRELVRDPNIQAWFRALAAYAEIQLALADENELISSWRVPDRRPARLPSLIGALIEEGDSLHLGHPEGLSRADLGRISDCMPRLVEMCDELSEGPVPSSLNHGDLHDGNIFLHNGDFVFFDWGDCSLTHPFVSIRTVYVSIENRLGWEENDRRFTPLNDSYLQAWADFGSLEELRAGMRIAQTVAPLVSALSWNRALANLPTRADEYVEPVPRLLEEFLSNLHQMQGDERRSQ